MKKLLAIIVGIPTIILMVPSVIVGFVFEAIITGWLAGRGMFKSFDDFIRKS